MAAAWEEAEQAGFSHPEPPREEWAAPPSRILGDRRVSWGPQVQESGSGTMIGLGLILGSAAHWWDPGQVTLPLSRTGGPTEFPQNHLAHPVTG